MADDQPMWDKRSEVQFTSRSAIKKTEGKMVEINKGLIKMINTISFDGEPSRNPYQHLEAFEDICDLFNTREDEVKLWVLSISKVNKVKAEIRNFKQETDNLVKAWERHKDLFLIFPNHGIDDKEMMDIFYVGLTNDSRLRLDSSCGGIFPYKSVKEARKLLDDMEAHYLDWSIDEEQEEKQPAHLNVVSSSEEHATPTEESPWKPTPLSQPEPHGGIIEQLFHQFSQEQGKMGVDVEQNLQGFVVEPEVDLPSCPTKEVRDEAVRPKESATPHVSTRVPYPARLWKEKKEAQFLKELVANKARMGAEEIAFLNAECSATLSDTLKKGDPGSFTIPCYFGKGVSCRALADLGASINLMPLSFYQNLGLENLKSTRMAIQLADRSIKYPVGIAEDVTVRVNKFTFPADFVILDIKDEVKIPLILGRPFLNTASAVIHVAKRELSLGIGEDRITLSIDRTLDCDESINTLDNLDDFTEPFESEPNDHLFESGELEESLSIEKRWDETVEREEEEFEELKQEDKVRVRTSLEEPPNLELKNLPEHLEYRFLEGSLTMPLEKTISLCPLLIKCLNDWREMNTILDGFSGYFQIPIDPEDQEKTTFTCPFGTFAYRRMPFGLCNAPTTFQRCMTAIFQDMIEDCMEVFMDDFSVFGNSFDDCLNSLDRVLARCEESHLVLNWEKCHFMVREGIVLGHKISKDGLEVDKAKIDTISKLPPSTNIKGVRSFLGHVGFYRRFFKDFSKITRPLTKLLEKDAPFIFDEKCISAFETLKHHLTNAHIMVPPDWDQPFEIMCDASDYAVGAVLGQLYTDHSALKYLFAKPDAKPRLIRWILLLQEFDIEVRDKRGAENLAADHLSHLENPYMDSGGIEVIRDKFPDEDLNMIKTIGEDPIPWYADFANYLTADVLVKGPDRIPRRCVSGPAAWGILDNCHKGPTRGHFGANLTARKVLESRFYWHTIFKDAHTLIKSCDVCQRAGNITKKDEMPPQSISVSEVFDVWGIDFMGPFPDSKGNKYILVAVDYVSKWAEAKASPTNDPKVVVNFVKSLVCRYGCPKAIISDRGTHFANYLLEKTLKRYGVHHRFSTAYHPQANGQAENTNRALKRILEKTVDNNPKIWSQKLEDALWAYRTAYKTPIGSTPYRMLYGKACHLPFEFEYKALWALKKVHLDDIASGREILISLHELEELRSLAYENSKIYKEQRKKWHDAHLKEVKLFKEADKVLMYQTRFKFSPGKLKSRWIGPYVVLKSYPSGYVDLMSERGEFKRTSSSRNFQDHPCLSFDSDNILRSEKMSLMIELDRLKKQDVEIGSIVDLHFVEEIGFGDRLSSLLRREYRDHFGVLRFVSNDWEKALKTHEPIYYELVLEFLATFSFDVEAYEEDRFDGPCVRFRLLGECAEFVGADFWATIGSGPYLQSNTKKSSIILPEHRLLHRMLVHSFAYRKAIKEKVPEGDLWLLSRMVDRNSITNLSYMMAKMFQSAGKVHDKARTGLCGGLFITVIAEKLGTLTPDVCETLTKLSPIRFLDKMGVEHHEMMERLDRISYDMYGVRRELSWVTASMSEYFESVGHAPSATLEPHPVWRDSDDGPTGYSTYDEWAFENRN
ncbi:hypothetical protein OSB04_029245 [Centaurea solstitialis]|uniref:Integrase catalytic domain-containing protein n=1 Tax=Centaurea solstitialis TaxID=347529 RepID=A0AA38SIW5_9ASTR|nr:hypothetical protein OSB04_029245 [Centaurea solstitialis]